ncbi:unnamed protein product [Protopolystoma xenopodis]|uniref:Uncharacterized protein n=1 Tax=Protopolystoma xenopodis TaxID=117903 RepID=A0A3S4ZUF1_9PLAT|nr:unnamed protein product [Protopolystoma xenopodis]
MKFHSSLDYLCFANKVWLLDWTPSEDSRVTGSFNPYAKWKFQETSISDAILDGSEVGKAKACDGFYVPQPCTKLLSFFQNVACGQAWIASRSVVASSHDLGVDLDTCCLLRDRFTAFCKDTNQDGRARVSAFCQRSDLLIEALAKSASEGRRQSAQRQSHRDQRGLGTESPLLAADSCDDFDEEFESGRRQLRQVTGPVEPKEVLDASAEAALAKDRVNEAWADLLELIDTRIQLLKSASDMHRFVNSCQVGPLSGVS